jgi:GT2 family glycosyltransferase
MSDNQLFIKLKEEAKLQTAVVILNYNGKNWLAKFLPSVLRYTKNALIVVADNGSTDDSIAFVQQHFPSIYLIRSDKNWGFAEGYNKALEKLQNKFNLTYYVLLNSDVEVSENWLPPLVKVLASDEKIAACQPKIKAYADKTKFEYAGAGGGFIDFLGYPYCRGRIFDTLETDNGQYDDTVPVFWASGACLAIKAQNFHAVGGFDGDFFAHMEEIDLCWRLKSQGFAIYYCGKSTIYHVGGGTLQTNSPKKSMLNFRNSLVMLLKNLPTAKLLPILFVRMLLDGLAALHLLTKGHFWGISVVLQAHFYLYANLFELWEKRQKTQKIGTKLTQFAEKEISQKSIVWQYFVQKKKYYQNEPQNKN